MNKYVIELRWDPILGEWVMVSNIREKRPWQPRGGCPFCPGTLETGYDWEVLILPNKFPMLMLKPPKPTKHHKFFKVSKAIGECKVLIETPVHDVEDLHELSAEQLTKILILLVKEVKKYLGIKWAKYFMFFRNKGKEIGVSLTHPHSQIYVLPFIPNKVMRELKNSRSYFKRKGRCLFCDVIDAEKSEGTRVIYENNLWIAFIPFFSHWPFEIHIYPKRHTQLLTDLNSTEIKELALALKTVLCGLNSVLGKPMPYMMVLHQSPLKGNYDFYHLHLEIYGAFRSIGKLKYAASMEHGGGNFTYDDVPEENAKRLREAIKNCMI